MLSFGLNQVTMAQAPIDEFVEVAARLGMVGIELRNDLDRPVLDGLPAGSIRNKLQDNGLRLLGLSQIYPFNRWSGDIAFELQVLIDLAVEAGAETISLIPCNDGTGLDEHSRIKELTLALEACLPLLESAGMVALVEPLGFASSSLRDKAELVKAITALDVQDRVRLVHDTFHHRLAGGGPIYTDNTGIVHISGVSDPTVAVGQMQDEHRVLIDADDRLGNLDQIKELRAAGYCGVYSFECFAPVIHKDIFVEHTIRTSMNFISSQMQDVAA